MPFSAGIVILCEDLRDSHIIRERPGSWHRRKGLEPSSGGFGDRCSAIKLRLHMSPAPGLEPGSVRTQLRVHRPGGLCLPPCECRYRLTGILVVAKSALFRFRRSGENSTLSLAPPLPARPVSREPCVRCGPAHLRNGSAPPYVLLLTGLLALTTLAHGSCPPFLRL